jgi:5-methylcytosine-specific restriction endonuclease McrA
MSRPYPRIEEPKDCPSCELFLPPSHFNSHTGHCSGLQSYCKSCMSQYHKRYTRLSTTRRSERYYARDKKFLSQLHQLEIKQIYSEAKYLRSIGIDVHVDHIVPLKGELVSGLHVPWNLQILSAQDNLSKSNKLTDILYKRYDTLPYHF